MNVGQPLNDDKVREVVDNIITHPSFRAALSNILNNSCNHSTTTTNDITLSSPPLFRPANDNSSGCAANVRATSVQQSSSNNTNPCFNPSTNQPPTANGRYTTPCEEFSALSRPGSSRGRAPLFQSGISHRQSARARRRTATAPYTRGTDNDRPRKREEMFRSKEIILLPDSKADRVVRPPQKANLMEHGFVLSEVMINKNWSDKEVFQYLDQCFKEKLSSKSFSSVEVGATTISTRYAFVFFTTKRLLYIFKMLNYLLILS